MGAAVMQDKYQSSKGAAVREEGDPFKIQNRQTDRQADGKTDRDTDGLDVIHHT